MFANLYFWIFAALIVLRVSAEFAINRRMRANAPFRRGEAVSLAVLTLSHAVSALAAGYYLFISSSISTTLFALGCSLFVLGFAGRVVGLRRLGKSYSQKIDSLQGSTLVTTGIYSVIRHPLYFFYTLEMVGLVLVCPNYVSLVMLVLELSATGYRINYEEKVLSAKFGDGYVEYQKKAKRFIPYLY